MIIAQSREQRVLRGPVQRFCGPSIGLEAPCRPALRGKPFPLANQQTQEAESQSLELGFLFLVRP